MNDYININDFIKNYDDYKENASDNDDLYYNDTIINYDII